MHWTNFNFAIQGQTAAVAGRKMTEKHKHEISEGAMRSTKKRKKRAPETKKRRKGRLEKNERE
jgi:hypothetical protein